MGALSPSTFTSAFHRGERSARDIRTMWPRTSCHHPCACIFSRRGPSRSILDHRTQMFPARLRRGGSF
eukprot:3935014-Pyramimonas_sp.AAC.1